MCVCKREHRGMSKSGFPLQCVRIPHANPAPGRTSKACMLCKNVPQTHASHSARELAWIWRKFGIFLVHANVCACERVWERERVGWLLVCYKKITSLCSCAEPTRESKYSLTNMRPDTHCIVHHYKLIIMCTSTGDMWWKNYNFDNWPGGSKIL